VLCRGDQCDEPREELRPRSLPPVELLDAAVGGGLSQEILAMGPGLRDVVPVEHAESITPMASVVVARRRASSVIAVTVAMQDMMRR